MFYSKPKPYRGRWLVKMIQAALVFGIAFFALDALNQTLNSPMTAEPNIVIQPVIVESNVVESDYSTLLDAEDYFTRALNHQVAGEYYDAITDYSRSLELNSDLSSAWLNRGVAYEQLGTQHDRYRAMVDFNNFLMRDGMTIMAYSTIQESQNEVIMMSFGYRYDFALDLKAGQVVNIRAVSVIEDWVDPIIVLANEAGNPVAANDDVRRQDGSLIAANAYINNYTVSESGYYVLHVSHAGGGSEGDVEVSISIDN